MRKFILTALTIIALSACCRALVFIDIENLEQRQVYIECLRLNQVDFALKDDGTIVIIGDETYTRLKKLDIMLHDASVKRNLEICRPK